MNRRDQANPTIPRQTYIRSHFHHETLAAIWPPQQTRLLPWPLLPLPRLSLAWSD